MRLKKIAKNLWYSKVDSYSKATQNLLSNLWWGFPAPVTQTNWIMKINVKKWKLQVLSKNAKIHNGKKLKTIPFPLENMQ